MWGHAGNSPRRFLLRGFLPLALLLAAQSVTSASLRLKTAATTLEGLLADGPVLLTDVQSGSILQITRPLNDWGGIGTRSTAFVEQAAGGVPWAGNDILPAGQVAQHYDLLETQIHAAETQLNRGGASADVYSATIVKSRRRDLPAGTEVVLRHQRGVRDARAGRGAGQAMDHEMEMNQRVKALGLDHATTAYGEFREYTLQSHTGAQTLEPSTGFFMILNKLSGGTLCDAFKPSGTDSDKHAALFHSLGKILDDVLSTLEQLHAAGLIHGDIKCDNIMLSRPCLDGSAPEKCDAQIIDYGLTSEKAQNIPATETPGTLTNPANPVLSTKYYGDANLPFYWPPEINPRFPVGSFDTYELGVMLATLVRVRIHASHADFDRITDEEYKYLQHLYDVARGMMGSVWRVDSGADINAPDYGCAIPERVSFATGRPERRGGASERQQQDREGTLPQCQWTPRPALAKVRDELNALWSQFKAGFPPSPPLPPPPPSWLKQGQAVELRLPLPDFAMRWMAGRVVAVDAFKQIVVVEYGANGLPGHKGGKKQFGWASNDIRPPRRHDPMDVEGSKVEGGDDGMQMQVNPLHNKHKRTKSPGSPDAVQLRVNPLHAKAPPSSPGGLAPASAAPPVRVDSADSPSASRVDSAASPSVSSSDLAEADTDDFSDNSVATPSIASSSSSTSSSRELASNIKPNAPKPTRVSSRLSSPKGPAGAETPKPLPPLTRQDLTIKDVVPPERGAASRAAGKKPAPAVAKPNPEHSPKTNYLRQQMIEKKVRQVKEKVAAIKREHEHTTAEDKWREQDKLDVERQHRMVEQARAGHKDHMESIESAIKYFRARPGGGSGGGGSE